MDSKLETRQRQQLQKQTEHVPHEQVAAAATVGARQATGRQQDTIKGCGRVTKGNIMVVPAYWAVSLSYLLLLELPACIQCTPGMACVKLAPRIL
jgi:hypothetical protein